MAKRAVLLLAGPTAVGKTEIGIEIAELLNGEIVSADARQVYQSLDIGTAKPTLEQRQRARHHLIDICTPAEQYSAARFLADAQAAIADIHSRGKTAIVVGGTGLYFKVLTDGLFEAPPISDETKVAVDALAAGGNEALITFLQSRDPVTLDRIDRRNTARLRRAAEFHMETGASLAETWRQSPRNSLPYRWFNVVVARPRPELYERAQERVDAMLRSGWLGEVQGLMKKCDFALPAFDAVGYRELEAVVLNKVTLEEGRYGIVERTRQYIKRQLTWFRHQGQWRAVGVEPDVSSKIASGFAAFAENKSA
jgi:tRNA dimethylallyltransferase